MTRLDCAAVDELDAAFSLGALPDDEARAVAEHLRTCREPHAALRSAFDVGGLLIGALAPVEPRPQLRERLMATIAATPQGGPIPATTTVPRQRPAPERSVPAEPRRGWLDWLSPGWARGLAAAALVGVVALGGWNAVLQGQLSDQRRAMDAVAEAVAAGGSAYRVEGEAGSGWLVANDETATFIGADLADAGDKIMELWLIDADGTPEAAGVMESVDDLAIAQLDQSIAGYATFAVTLEDSFVEAPTGAPVMVGSLQ